MRARVALTCLLALAMAAGALAAPAGAATRPLSRAAAAPRVRQARVSRSALSAALARAMSAASGASSAYVIDVTTGRVLFQWKARAARTLASNTKLFTSVAVLGRYGPGSTLATMLLGMGSLDSSGVWHGNIYVRGGGDPTFGSRAFAQRAYGSDASVEALAHDLSVDGVRQVTGSVIGDESLFDSLRGGPDSHFGVSIYVGPLSALSYDRGLANPSGSAFQLDPPAFAASKLEAALRRDGIGVGGGSHGGVTPPGSVELAEVRSPSAARVIQLMDKSSDNFFAEMLVKGLPVASKAGGPLRPQGQPLPPPPVPGGASGTPVPLPVAGVGTTLGGARDAAAFAATLGARPHLVDGSGLSHADRVSPRGLATLLARVASRPYFQVLFNALSIAGRDGTLRDRMRSGPARGRCHAKTGTLTGVSALSGYCRSVHGHLIAFSILMNGVSSIGGARSIQDRMAQAIARF